MSCMDTEFLSSLFLLPKTIAIEAVCPTKTHLTVQVACLFKSAACPLCQHSSERIHGRYERRVADVPCGGRRVTLALTVRKFVCRTPDCPRTIFTERLPDLVQSYARMTKRQPGKALRRHNRWQTNSTYSKISVRGSKISWIADTPVYPKWKKKDPTLFPQRHKGSKIAQSTRVSLKKGPTLTCIFKQSNCGTSTLMKSSKQSSCSS
jgi:transposase